MEAPRETAVSLTESLACTYAWKTLSHFKDRHSSKFSEQPESREKHFDSEAKLPGKQGTDWRRDSRGSREGRNLRENERQQGWNQN